MARPTPSELLAAWERGLGLPAPDRSLALLAAGDSGASAEELASLTVGERDARLLELREWAFGSAMTGTAACPACGAGLELPVDVRQIAPGVGAPAPNGTVAVGDHEIHYRLPDSRDLHDAALAGTIEGARAVLLERCVVSALCGRDPVSTGELPDEVVERVEAQMADAGGACDVQLALACPDCRHEWQADFDAGVFLWGEIDQWARRMLVDVAALAAAYGWTEFEVLALGPARREAYLELAAR
jgi:hypothetical protein